eukprot:3494687-Amphidinium_carterae.1
MSLSVELLASHQHHPITVALRISRRIQITCNECCKGNNDPRLQATALCKATQHLEVMELGIEACEAVIPGSGVNHCESMGLSPTLWTCSPCASAAEPMWQCGSMEHRQATRINGPNDQFRDNFLFNLSLES